MSVGMGRDNAGELSTETIVAKLLFRRYTTLAQSSTTSADDGQEVNVATHDSSTRSLVGSVEDLLSPATLSRLTGRSVTLVRSLPFNSVDGRSGSTLAAVEVEGAGSYVLKRISWQTDVIMRLTDDRAGRAVAVLQQGMLDRLPSQIAHGVVACALDE